MNESTTERKAHGGSQTVNENSADKSDSESRAISRAVPSTSRSTVFPSAEFEAQPAFNDPPLMSRLVPAGGKDARLVPGIPRRSRRKGDIHPPHRGTPSRNLT